jgi:hypothetical protein
VGVTREEFNALLSVAVKASLDGLPRTNPADAAALAERHDATEEVRLLQAEAIEFADAVDRDGKRIPYGSAVVLEGPGGVVVCTAADYAATPTYWRVLAGGTVDRLVKGTELLHVLQEAANRGPARTS